MRRLIMICVMLPMWVISISFSQTNPSQAAQNPNQPEAKPEDSGLLGKWECDSGLGLSTLIFISNERLNLDGEEAVYSLMPGVIRVVGLDGAKDYPYALNGQILTVTFPPGIPLQYKKAQGAWRPSNENGLADAQTKSQFETILMSSKWCSISYNANTGYSSSTIVQFFMNGTYKRSARSEGYSSGSGGSMASQSDAGSTGRWKVENNLLYIAEGQGPMNPVQIQVQLNSNGSPIILADGVEYSQCN